MAFQPEMTPAVVTECHVQRKPNIGGEDSSDSECTVKTSANLLEDWSM
jgi:hypothetical protein